MRVKEKLDMSCECGLRHEQLWIEKANGNPTLLNDYYNKYCKYCCHMNVICMYGEEEE